ncbi:putative protein SUPPRESSOR OF GENE SILENCING 3 [Cocos nucifera]|uniref:Zinc finger-XS domain-containing protein n=1 Tax=Cocos nucifera TaxID=13894 RepID=A0A8K0HZL0_COCNU|nr:putative protein SUPPRESSOR OF GENE SILENCING 3 [Cocos nucifera]
MNSRKGGGKTFSGAATGGGNPSPNGKGIEESTFGKGSPKADQLSQDTADMRMDAQDGGWEVYAKKSRGRSGASAGAAAKSSGSSNSATKACGRPEGVPRQGWGTNGGAGRTSGNNWAQTTDSRRPVGRGNSKPQPSNKGWESQYMAPPPVIPPPLQHGWQWAARGCSSGSQPKREEIRQDGTVGRYNSETDTAPPQVDNGSDENELVEDSDDDFSDDYDSDESQKSHETRKKNRWFKGFFEDLDKLSVEEISEQTRQWHCPACHNGPGAIEWYKGLQPLMTHAKTKGATRVKLHRDFAVLLEEELHRRGTSVVPAGEAFGKWKGLRETTTDHLIVWPPMVVIMNTLLQKDETDKVLLHFSFSLHSIFRVKCYFSDYWTIALSSSFYKF